MKTFFLVFFVAFSLTGGCEQSDTSALLGITFRHAFEDDRDGLRAYRPDTYDFPPARGRSGFRLEEEGKFISLDIARGDGTSQRTGSWTLLENDPPTLEITLPARQAGAPEEKMRWEVLSFQDSLLLVRPTE